MLRLNKIHRPVPFGCEKCHKLWQGMLLSALLLVYTGPALGMYRGDRGKMTNHISETYQESRSGLGLAQNGAVVELYTADTGTWTILLTRPGGPTCALAVGEAWEQQDPTVVEKGTTDG